MTKPRSILCGGITLGEDDPLRNGRHVLHLATRGPDANVNVRLMDLAKVFLKHLSPRLEDLLEIAAYVYSTDCATVRGGEWSDDKSVEPWPRDFQLVIPVRDHAFWTREDVLQLLQQALQFLSEDKYSLVFRPMAKQHNGRQEFFKLDEHQDDWPFYSVDRILMFSGGLDSLAGAIETAARGERLVLVSHRPVSIQSKKQTDLVNLLRKTYPGSMIHVAVCINKDKNKSKEHTQRTRSFLYSALGAIVAASVKANGVRFFENGIVSLNLPVADEVIGSRASRTTHPWALALFGRFYSLVLDRELVVDNPFQFMTKSEVVKIIAENGDGRLIGYTCSCAHQGRFRSRSQQRCGTCSQCIDRRIAVIAAEQEANDPETDYVIDVFTGPRKEGYEQNMAVDYTRHAYELCGMSEEEMVTKFNTEFARASRPFPRQSKAAQEFIAMHKRHGAIAKKVIDGQFKVNAGRFFEGTLPESSLLAKVAGQAHRTSSWRRYAGRIVKLLEVGVPKIYSAERPKDEPRLQQICDGILTANDEVLVREFPFMSWGSNLTKPDWSAEGIGLWVELKYVRKDRGTRQISKDIAADITKYGDNQRRVLFVVYDPDRVIVDDRAFSEPVEKREDMYMAIIR
jgi:7-cyano-7-deazaguanine synthase in queuosine biosynthesis